MDATTGNMVNHEVPQLEEEGFDINYFYPTDYGVPQSYELVFLAGKDAVDKILKKSRNSCVPAARALTS